MTIVTATATFLAQNIIIEILVGAIPPAVWFVAGIAGARLIVILFQRSIGK